MNKDELKTFIKENFCGKSEKLKSSNYLKKKFPKEYEEVIKLTSFLPNDTLFAVRVFYVQENLSESRKCKTCGTELKIKGKNEFYNKSFCSNSCAKNNEEVKERQKKTNLERYGVENPSQIGAVKERRRKTNLDRYGVENPSELKSVQDKIKKTNLERYGYSCPLQNDNVKEKRKKSYQKKYGVNHPMQNNDVKDKIKKTNLEKYGVEYTFQSKEVKEKIKKTNLKKYGVENPTQSKEVKDKIKKTNLERYGYKCSLQNKDVKKKTKKTNLERYGVEYPLQSKNAKNKQKKTNLKRYGVENPMQNNDVKDKIKKTNLEKYGVEYTFQKHILHYDEFTCNEKFLQIFNNNSFNKVLHYFNITKRTLYLRCKSLGIIFDNIITTGHQQYIDYIKSLDENIKIEINDRSVISPLELDIYLPDYNLAIEFNGIYWHAEGNGKDRNYHLNKTLLCGEKGIQLLHIFENENEEIWKSVIASKLGFSKRIYARKCKLGIINENEYQKFLKLNHLQGYSVAKYKYGLFYNEELVAVMSFSKSRYNKKYDYELIRYCNKRNTTIVGGASKLLSYFKKENKGTIISYANRRWSNGNLYNALGFTQIKTANPNYFYVVDGNLKSRLEYQKHKLKDKLSEFDDKLTEWENMQLNGYDRIWDCGNLVFVSQ